MRREFLKYLMLEWIIPVGLGAAIVGSVAAIIAYVARVMVP